MATFMSVDSFKERFEITTMKVVENAKTNKLSVLVDGTDFIRCQQGIDSSKELAFMANEDEESMDSWCLINVKRESPLTDKFSL